MNTKASVFWGWMAFTAAGVGSWMYVRHKHVQRKKELYGEQEKAVDPIFPYMNQPVPSSSASAATAKTPRTAASPTTTTNNTTTSRPVSTPKQKNPTIKE
ncbi:hypothetical protein QOT17_024650 [Balamuthia mandrillaris]